MFPGVVSEKQNATNLMLQMMSNMSKEKIQEMIGKQAMEQLQAQLANQLKERGMIVDGQLDVAKIQAETGIKVSENSLLGTMYSADTQQDIAKLNNQNRLDVTNLTNEGRLNQIKLSAEEERKTRGLDTPAMQYKGGGSVFGPPEPGTMNPIKLVTSKGTDYEEQPRTPQPPEDDSYVEPFDGLNRRQFDDAMATPARNRSAMFDAPYSNLDAQRFRDAVNEPTRPNRPERPYSNEMNANRYSQRYGFSDDMTDQELFDDTPYRGETTVFENSMNPKNHTTDYDGGLNFDEIQADPIDGPAEQSYLVDAGLTHGQYLPSEFGPDEVNPRSYTADVGRVGMGRVAPGDVVFEHDNDDLVNSVERGDLPRFGMNSPMSNMMETIDETGMANSSLATVAEENPELMEAVALV